MFLFIFVGLKMTSIKSVLYLEQDYAKKTNNSTVKDKRNIIHIIRTSQKVIF